MISFFNYGTDDFIFIRSSGNPLDAEGFSAMFQSSDLTLHDSELIALERLNFHGNVAILVFTMRETSHTDGKTTLTLIWLQPCYEASRVSGDLYYSKDQLGPKTCQAGAPFLVNTSFQRG